MSLEVLTSFLAWCTRGNWMRRKHGQWFKLSDESFAAIHYKVLAYFKLLWVFFNLTPYLVLRLFL